MKDWNTSLLKHTNYLLGFLILFQELRSVQRLAEDLTPITGIAYGICERTPRV
jgi:hypothetical protein